MSSTVTSSATPTESIFATQEGVARVQKALADSGLDGWLLCEYRGLNWIAASLLAVGGTTRRAFVLVPRVGRPRLLLHAIEASAWRHWPWEREVYAGWREMEAKLGALVGTHAKLAMEVSPASAVPTVDAVPWGMVEMLRGLGVEPVSSQDLISLFHSVWSDDQLVEHRRAAEIIAEVAHDGFLRAADAVRKGTPTTEGALNRWIVQEMASRGVAVDQDAHVAVGPGAADPHYAPAGEGRTIGRDQVLLIDLWGRTSATAVAADQTWMGWVGERVPDEVARVWDIVRDSRDAAVDFLKRQHAAGAEVRGFEVDDVSRQVIDSAGFGSYFVHRTGHSIDTRLHGSGPNLDNLESRDERRLLRGVGFSVEPGIYLPDRFGIRSEINVHWGAQGPEVTPQRIQTDLPALLANG